MEKRYEPSQYETKIYKLWEKSKFFNPDNLPGKRKKIYSISIPPPNITGSLHLGHALNSTIQDIVTRFQRMMGKKMLWLPGTDHAGIATQNIIEKELAKQGLTRQQIGRKKFVEKVWEWKEKYGNVILNQLKKLGCSCDWSRTRFTLDKGYSDAVQTAFINYWRKGYIYRGPRIVNWCPRCSTAISDIEIKYQEQETKLWHIKYPLKDNPNKFIVVATTRPETMLGDTAVAVSPKDERYKELIGQIAILPIMNREIPIISHHLVDPEFGTGAVKITPAHDNIDWKIGKENKLDVINVIDPNAKMTKMAGNYTGLDVLEARRKIIQELKNQKLLEKQEGYTHQISLCDRCGTAIEPQISTQWFVKMEKLAAPAIKVVEKNKIKIIPQRYKKIYLDWLKNVEDWCISRQLWWGHQLPVWFCQASDNKPKKQCFVVCVNKPLKCSQCGATEFKQSEDVLDTWFSSALWPLATLGWPEKTKDLKQYYPTSFLSTAPEILYLWVARMVFSSLEFLKKIPFYEVYLHTTVLNIEGRRMSKSLGTGVDPLELIEKYGADATRLGIVYSMSLNQQAMRFDERNLIATRNFINKLWNISRFIQIQSRSISDIQVSKSKNIKPITLADKWILSRVNGLIDSVTKKIEQHELGEAVREIYEFAWHEFADWYIEISKWQIDNKEQKINTLYCLQFILHNLLKLLHPFIPFVTEQIWQSLNTKTQNKLLIVQNWPKADKKLINQKLEQEFIPVKNLATEIRNWKTQQNIPLKEIKEYKIKSENKNLLAQDEQKDLVEKLAKVILIS